MNHLKFRCLAVALAVTASFPCVAADTLSGGDLPTLYPQKDTNFFRLGLAAISRQSAYRDFDDEVTAAPLIMYKHNNFFWRISEGGYNFFDDASKHQIAAIVEIGPDIWDKEDLADDSALRDLPIKERHRAFNAGLTYSYRDSWGRIKVKAVADVSGSHEGSYGDVSYSYPWRATNELTLTVTIGVNLLDSDYATYYYGFPDSTAVEELDDSTRVYASILGTYNINTKWQVIGFLKGQSLDSELEDNPGVLSERRLTDDDAESVIGLGFMYNF